MHTIVLYLWLRPLRHAVVILTMWLASQLKGSINISPARVLMFRHILAYIGLAGSMLGVGYLYGLDQGQSVGYDRAVALMQAEVVQACPSWYIRNNRNVLACRRFSFM